MNQLKSQVQDAASWYFSHIDPFSPNYENVQRYLRGPLIALTINHALPSAFSGDGAPSASLPKKEEKENKNGTTQNWRDYLPLEQSSAVSMSVQSPGTPASHSTQANKDAHQAYQNLSRRTQARMEAFLAGCALAAPNELAPNKQNIDQQPSDLVSLQEGLSGFGISAVSSNSSTPPSTLIRNISTRNNQTLKHPQIQREDLILRMELYLRTLQRVRNVTEECVIAMESPKAIKARARVVTHAFVATAGTIRSLRHVLTRLLNCLTMEELAVEVLSEDVKKVIHKIVSEYEHGTSFASLAFLSTPEANADSLLMPLIVKYLRYLQTNWEQLISTCELERMLTRAIDPEMRTMFKTIEFRSIGHLLEVCHEQRAKLQQIELAPHVCAIAENINSLIHSKDAIRQAIRDLQREIITVNGHVLPPVNSRKDLLKVLGQTLNSRTLTAAERSRRRKGGKKNKDSKAAQQNYRQNNSATPTRSKNNKANIPDTPGSTDDSDFLFSSEAESSILPDDSSLSEGVDSPSPDSRKPKHRRRNFHLSTIDILTRRLLIAASRTGNGGDAYFVVRDLFGGEEVEVVPTETLPTQSRMVRPGTIDILVRLASVTIKCHQSFDIYPRTLVRECEPLIQFHTTTTETISLQEVRANDEFKNVLEVDQVFASASSQHVDADSSMLILQEKEQSSAGWRTISVRPAIYEKVQTWGTPS